MMTEEENNKSESKEEPPKFNQEQYDRLIECSKKGPEGIKEWNEWRNENRSEEIWLQGARLRKANLQEIDLMNANLQGADIRIANLQGAYLCEAKLQRARLRGIKLQKAHLEEAKLQGADLKYAKLQGAELEDVELQGAVLHEAKLQEANLHRANLQGADIRAADLEGADLRGAELQGARFSRVIVSGSTNFFGCKIDKDTDFCDTSLDNTRIGSGTKILLKYNIRRMNWTDWYWGSGNHKVYDKKGNRPIRRACYVLGRLLITSPIRLFWKISNYGISTKRLMAWFLGLALAFACVYWLWPRFVMVNGEVGDIRGFVHGLYFSVVTMTTLGFGDIAANPDSWVGQVVLMVQVILGYVLLGALVTRLGVLFTSDGPAGSFTPMDEETKELLAKLKEDRK